jgi:peptide chain release factor subunit 3
VESKEEEEEPKREQKVEEAEQDLRDHLNVVFIGHVDAGKSTIAGNILYLTGMIDPRILEKYEREAKDKSRSTWFIAYIMDTNEEERAKGKTVEVGRAYFETKEKRYTILDAPGHKNYVPNMIGGAAQADVGILVISARTGEFEAGFERGGQTREHAMLAKTIGIKQLVVVINKMDDRNWDKTVYDDIVTKISTFLKKDCQFQQKDLFFLPISGFHGFNLVEPMSKEVCPWYDGKSLLQTLDAIPTPERCSSAPLRIPVIDRYKEMGMLNIIGKVEAGTITKGQNIYIMPNKIPLKVSQLCIDEKLVSKAAAGENIKVGILGGEDGDIAAGQIICSIEEPISMVSEFTAQVVITELLPTNPLFTAGYEAVMHVHTCVREITILDLINEIDKKTKKPSKKKPMFVKGGAIVTCRIQPAASFCAETFEKLPQLGRFTLRDKGKTIAIGKILTI